MKFEEAVKKELKRARKLHSPIKTPHAGYAFILEELDEVWEEIKKKPENRKFKNIYKELIHVSAVSQRLAEDVIEKEIIKK